MKTLVLLLGCALAVASYAQTTTTKRELWEWKDASGVTHYSDVPAPGARKITLTGTVPVAQPAPAAPSTSAEQPARGETRKRAGYSALEIVAPEEGASFFGADAVVEVQVRSEPSLVEGDRLQLYLDGSLVQGENYALANLERGEHSVVGVILDSQGNEMIRSNSRTFYIKQINIDNPRNTGPSVRPRPQPQGGG
jgi:hypothetical protein